MPITSRSYLRIGALLLVLVAVSIVAGVLAYRYEQRRAQEIAARSRGSIEVVVAVRDLYVGVPIAEEDVTVRLLNPDEVPADFVYSDIADVIRRVPRERILGNELVRVERLASNQADAGVNALLTRGNRVANVPLGNGVLAPGQLRTGNYVDLQLFLPVLDATGRVAKTETCLLKSLRVLMVDGALVQAPRVGDKPASGDKAGSSRSSDSPTGGLTVEVSPEEGTILARAVVEGEVYPLQRSDIDILVGPGVSCVPEPDGAQ